MTLATEPVDVRPAGRSGCAGRCSAPAALAAATLALHVRDPHVTHSWGVCPLYALTGIYCPGCGGLRGVNDLTDGHLGAAASSNLLLVLRSPSWSCSPAGLGSWQGASASSHAAAGQWASALVVAFSVARNLPGSWLAP